jgi:Fic family protein
MDRTSGEWVSASTAGSRYRAFVPRSLPPEPPLAFDASLVAQLERATRALGQLDGAARTLPRPELFLYHYVRKEALLSSQIEGTRSSLSDLLLFELEELPGVPVDDVEEVSNYIAALNHGLARMRGGFPLSLRLIREMHEVLLRGGRGARQTPGEFRRIQNWVGGRSPATASFVPPPPNRLDECLGAFERFLHAPGEHMPALAKAALAHHQFETIHPFLDGNGRLGRLLITLVLCADGVLAQPILYLSLFFKSRRAEYYVQLDRVRRTGDWETWLAFFLEGVEQVSRQGLETAQRILALFDADRPRLQSLGRTAGRAKRVFDAFTRSPLLSVAQIARQEELAPLTVRKAIADLEDMDLVVEITGQRRNRVWLYRAYYDILSEGAAPL